MKITLVSPVMANRSGGAEYVVCSVANGMAERGHQVEILHYADRPGAPFFPLDDSVGVQCIRPNTRPFGGPLRATLRQSIRKTMIGRQLPGLRWGADHSAECRWLKRHLISYRPDLVIAFTAGAFSITSSVCSALNIPFVLSVHNRPDKEFTDPSRWDPNPVDRKKRTKALGKAAAITVLLDEFRDWFPAYLEPKLFTVPNFVIPPDPLPARDSERSILSLGRLASVKDHQTLIAAWQTIAGDHPDWRVDIYGDGPLRGALDRQIRNENLQNSVHLHAPVRDVWSVYAKGDIYCHPATFEGFGLVVLEAMIAGLPVVGRQDCSGVNTLVADGASGLLVDPSDPVANMAHALRRLIQSETLRQQMGKTGQDRAKAYSRTRTMAKWDAVIAHAVPQLATMPADKLDLNEQTLSGIPNQTADTRAA